MDLLKESSDLVCKLADLKHDAAYQGDEELYNRLTKVFNKAMNRHSRRYYASTSGNNSII